MRIFPNLTSLARHARRVGVERIQLVPYGVSWVTGEPLSGGYMIVHLSDDSFVKVSDTRLGMPFRDLIAWVRRRQTRRNGIFRDAVIEYPADH